jgi:hypothetical protein
MGNLSNLYISKSYQSLIHLETDDTASSTLVGLQDGLGNSIGISVNTSGSLSISGSFTSSLQEGYVWVGNGSGRTILVPTSSFDGTTDLSALNAFTQSQDTKNSTLATYTASVDTKFNTIGTQSGSWDNTALNAFTQSQEAKNSTLATYTGSNDTKWNTLGGQTGSYVTSAITGSSIITASINNDDITFTKGDGSQFTIQVATGSYAETASLATNALDIVVNVKNTTGVQLNKGTVVRIIGATGDNPLIGTASWENDNNSANTLGFVVTDIPNDDFGRVMTQGTLLSVNTDPALGYTAGQLVYLSGSGQFTNVIPPSPYHEVRLGQVLRAQQNNGSIYVLVQNGYELTELHDVNISTASLANNDLLAWDSSSQQWENKTLTEVGGATTGSNVFRGNESITGSLVVTGSFNLWSEPNAASIISASLNGMKTTFRNSIDILGPTPTLRIATSTRTGSYSDTSVSFISSGKGYVKLDALALDLYSGSASGQTIHITGDSNVLGDDSYTPNRQGLFLTTGPFIFAGGKNLFTIDTSYVGKAYTDANLNFSNGLTITSGSLVVSGSTNLSGSTAVTGSISITQTMKLRALNPLPAGTIGELAVSGSNLYFYNGAWTLVI